MGSDSYTAIDMCNDKPQFLILSSDFSGKLSGDALLVENMTLRSSVYAFDSCYARYVIKLIHICRIDCVHRLVVFNPERVGKHDSELGWVVTSAFIVFRILVQPSVYYHDAFRL